LHVLNTPPAFVLSQNQTLRKKHIAVHKHSQIDLLDTLKMRAQPCASPRRAAHNLAFFSPLEHSDQLFLKETQKNQVGTLPAQAALSKIVNRGD
jgi:hypothetical protein